MCIIRIPETGNPAQFKCSSECSVFQGVVPRWQRRYLWGQAEIERLIEDLLTVADAEIAQDSANAQRLSGERLTRESLGATR